MAILACIQIDHMPGIPMGIHTFDRRKLGPVAVMAGLTNSLMDLRAADQPKCILYDIQDWLSAGPTFQVGSRMLDHRWPSTAF